MVDREQTFCLFKDDPISDANPILYQQLYVISCVIFQSGTMKVDIMGTERGLLGFMLAKIHKLDPDVIVVSVPE